MDGGSPPQIPDATATANAQGAANVDAARTTTALNRADQYTPFGSLTWTQGDPTRTFNQTKYDAAVKAAQDQQRAESWKSDGSGNMIYTAPTSPFQAPDKNDAQFYDVTPSDQWSSHINLDPRVQSIVDATLKNQGQLSGTLGTAIGNANTTLSQPVPVADEALRQKVEDAYYQRATSRLDPQYQQQEEALRSGLMNRGIVEGSQAWQDQMANFGRTKNDAYDLARTDAIQQGGNQEAQQLQMSNAQRTQILNELASLQTGSQVQMPSFGATPSGATVNPAPVAQSVYNNYQGQLGQYNSDVASSNAQTGAMASMAAAAIMFF